MTQKKSPLEQALDLFVYAPIGLTLTVRNELPKLVEKGRQRVSGQVTMARMVGQFAVAQGQKEAEKAVRETVGRFAGRAGADHPPTAAPPAATPAATGSPATATSPALDGNGAAAPSAAALAIPGYDSLSASQVAQRLAGLTRDELDAVRAYEAGTRSRRTILSRIDQLQSDASR